MVPFVDLKAEYRAIKAEIDEAIARVLESSQFVLGDEVEAFEREFAAFCGTKHSVAVNSGTSALHLALLAAGVVEEDEVITVPFTFVATVAAIRYVGARVVFVDIDARSFAIDVRQIERAITPRTRAVIPVHLYGQPADIDPLREIAVRHGLTIIEDAAQAHGARYKGRAVGGLGDAGCFSFYPSKNLGAYGEGGIVTTNRDDLTDRIRLLRDWGQRTKYEHVIAGYNARMQGLQAAILRVKLRHLAEWNERRRQHAARYNTLLADSGVTLPEELPYARHVYHQYIVRCGERDRLRALLRSAQIQTGLHYPIPVHLQPAYADTRYGVGAFPESERAAAEVLSLPMFPQMTGAQLQAVADAVRRAAVPGIPA